MTIVKKITTELKGKYLVGEVEDKGSSSKFVLEKIKTPSKTQTQLPVLALAEVEEMIAEWTEVKKVLSGVVTLVAPLAGDNPKFATYEGASDSISVLDTVFANGVVKITGEGKTVTKFKWFWGSDDEMPEGIYIALEFTPPTNIVDISNAKIKAYHANGTEKITDFDGILIQRIFADNLVSGREIAIAWDGINYESIKLDFTGVTGLTI